METKKFLYYQEDDMFIGWLDDYPNSLLSGCLVFHINDLFDIYKKN